MRLCHKNKNAFTIVELLIVIVIIGILASIVSISYSGIFGRAKEMTVLSSLSDIDRQIKIYQVEHNRYPESSELKTICSSLGAPDLCIKLPANTTVSVYNVDNSVNPQSYYLEVDLNDPYIQASYSISNTSPASKKQSFVTGGITLSLDSTDMSSYPKVGTTWNDLSGNNNTATMTGASYSKLYKGSIAFSGVSDSVSAGDPASLRISGPITLEAHVFAHDCVSYSGIIEKTNGAGIPYGMSFSASGCKLRFSANGATYDSNGTIPIGSWSHLVITYDSSNIKFYINGVLDATISAPSITFNSSAGYPVYLGMDPMGDNEHFSGRMSFVRIYNRAISQSEISQNNAVLQSRAIVQNGGLVFNIDAQNNTSYPGSGTTWSDLGVNSLNGTLVNGPAFDTTGGIKSISFDGINDYADFGYKDEFRISSEITLEAWVYLNSYVNWAGIVGHGDGGYTTYKMTLSPTNNKLRFGYNCGTYNNQVDSTGNIGTGVWTHVVTTYNGSDVKFYINGNLDSTVNIGAVKLGGSLKPLHLGHDPAGTDEFFNGRIGMVKIYEVALTSQKIIESYNLSKSNYGL